MTLARARLIADGMTEERIAAVEQATTAELEHAVENALAAPYPDPAVEAATEHAP